MIPQTTVLFTGALGVLASAGALSARYDVQTRTVLAAAAMACWAVYGYGMLDLGVSTGAGEFATFRVLSHTILAAVFGAIMLLFAFDNMRDML